MIDAREGEQGRDHQWSDQGAGHTIDLNAAEDAGKQQQQREVGAPADQKCAHQVVAHADRHGTPDQDADAGGLRAAGEQIQTDRRPHQRCADEGHQCQQGGGESQQHRKADTGHRKADTRQAALHGSGDEGTAHDRRQGLVETRDHHALITLFHRDQTDHCAYQLRAIAKEKENRDHQHHDVEHHQHEILDHAGADAGQLVTDLLHAIQRDGTQIDVPGGEKGLNACPPAGHYRRQGKAARRRLASRLREQVAHMGKDRARLTEQQPHQHQKRHDDGQQSQYGGECRGPIGAAEQHHQTRMQGIEHHGHDQCRSERGRERREYQQRLIDEIGERTEKEQTEQPLPITGTGARAGGGSGLVLGVRHGAARLSPSGAGCQGTRTRMRAAMNSSVRIHWV